MKKTIPPPVLFLLSSLLPCLLLAQNQPQQPPRPPTPTGYILGPNDQISVSVNEFADEFGEKTFRIDPSGDVSLPVIGHLHAIGLTIRELEDEARAALVHELKNPQVAISLAAYGGQTVSVLGAVNTPGLYQLEGHKTLFQTLSLAGGMLPEAGSEVTVTRDLKWGAIQLPQAVTDTSGRNSIATIRIKTLLTSSNLAENIQIFPGDTVSVPPTERVFVVGSVKMPGAFPLNGHETMSALQVVSLAEGVTRTAALDKVKILRVASGSPTRSEIPVNLKLLMAGKGPDVQLEPDDILFVPNSSAKSAGYRTIDAIIEAATFASRTTY